MKSSQKTIAKQDEGDDEIGTGGEGRGECEHAEQVVQAVPAGAGGDGADAEAAAAAANGSKVHRRETLH